MYMNPSEPKEQGSVRSCNDEAARRSNENHPDTGERKENPSACLTSSPRDAPTLPRSEDLVDASSPRKQRRLGLLPQAKPTLPMPHRPQRCTHGGSPMTYAATAHTDNDDESNRLVGLGEPKGAASSVPTRALHPPHTQRSVASVREQPLHERASHSVNAPRPLQGLSTGSPDASAATGVASGLPTVAGGGGSFRRNHVTTDASRRFPRAHHAPRCGSAPFLRQGSGHDSHTPLSAPPVLQSNSSPVTVTLATTPAAGVPLRTMVPPTETQTPLPPAGTASSPLLLDLDDVFEHQSMLLSLADSGPPGSSTPDPSFLSLHQGNNLLHASGDEGGAAGEVDSTTGWGKEDLRAVEGSVRSSHSVVRARAVRGVSTPEGVETGTPLCDSPVGRQTSLYPGARADDSSGGGRSHKTFSTTRMKDDDEATWRSLDVTSSPPPATAAVQPTLTAAASVMMAPRGSSSPPLRAVTPSQPSRGPAAISALPPQRRADGDMREGNAIFNALGAGSQAGPAGWLLTPPTAALEGGTTQALSVAATATPKDVAAFGTRCFSPEADDLKASSTANRLTLEQWANDSTASAVIGFHRHANVKCSTTSHRLYNHSGSTARSAGGSVTVSSLHSPASSAVAHPSFPPLRRGRTLPHDVDRPPMGVAASDTSSATRVGGGKDTTEAPLPQVSTDSGDISFSTGSSGDLMDAVASAYRPREPDATPTIEDATFIPPMPAFSAFETIEQELRNAAPEVKPERQRLLRIQEHYLSFFYHPGNRSGARRLARMRWIAILLHGVILSVAVVATVVTWDLLSDSQDWLTAMSEAAEVGHIHKEAFASASLPALVVLYFFVFHVGLRACFHATGCWCWCTHFSSFRAVRSRSRATPPPSSVQDRELHSLSWAALRARSLFRSQPSSVPLSPHTHPQEHPSLLHNGSNHSGPALSSYEEGARSLGLIPSASVASGSSCATSSHPALATTPTQKGSNTQTTRAAAAITADHNSTAVASALVPHRARCGTAVAKGSALLHASLLLDDAAPTMTSSCRASSPSVQAAASARCRSPPAVSFGDSSRPVRPAASSCSRTSTEASVRGACGGGKDRETLPADCASPVLTSDKGSRTWNRSRATRKGDDDTVHAGPISSGSSSVSSGSSAGDDDDETRKDLPTHSSTYSVASLPNNVDLRSRRPTAAAPDASVLSANASRGGLTPSAAVVRASERNVGGATPIVVPSILSGPRLLSPSAVSDTNAQGAASGRDSANPLSPPPPQQQPWRSHHHHSRFQRSPRHHGHRLSLGGDREEADAHEEDSDGYGDGRTWCEWCCRGLYQNFCEWRCFCQDLDEADEEDDDEYRLYSDSYGASGTSRRYDLSNPTPLASQTLTTIAETSNGAGSLSTGTRLSQAAWATGRGSGRANGERERHVAAQPRQTGVRRRRPPPLWKVRPMRFLFLSVVTIRAMYFLFAVGVLFTTLGVSFHLILDLALLEADGVGWYNHITGDENGERACQVLQLRGRCSGWRVLCNAPSMTREEAAFLGCPYCPKTQALIAEKNFRVTCHDRFEGLRTKLTQVFEAFATVHCILLSITATFMTYAVCSGAYG